MATSASLFTPQVSTPNARFSRLIRPVIQDDSVARPLALPVAEDSFPIDRLDLDETSVAQLHGPDGPKLDAAAETPVAASITDAIPPQLGDGPINGVDVPDAAIPPNVGPEDSVRAVLDNNQPQAVDDSAKFDWQAEILGRPLTVSIGEFGFEDFKNRWGEDAEYHVVELLVGSEKTTEEFGKEEARRAGAPGKRGQREEHKTSSSAADTWIQRIRIQSPVVLHYLQEAMNAPRWNTSQYRVFFRPFKALLYCQANMRRALERLEKQFAGANPAEAGLRPDDSSGANVAGGRPGKGKNQLDKGSGAKHVRHAMVGVVEDAPATRDRSTRVGGNGSGVSWNDADTKTVEKLKGRKPEEAETGGTDTLNDRTALEHLRCYVDFMDERVMPMEDIFDGNGQQMVRFDDLWFLFKVGDVVHCPAGSAAREAGRSMNTRTNRGRYQTAFSVFYKGLSVIDDSTPDDFKIKDRTMVLWCYYLDHDGETYGPVKQKLVIEAFAGQRSIRELTTYPLRFAVNADRLRSELETQGKRFRDLAKLKHVSCEGWTLTVPPLGTYERGDEETPEHIESDVIIDFAEAVRGEPSWKPEFEAPLPAEQFDDWSQGTDKMNILHWPSDEKITRSTEPWFSIVECTQRDDNTEEQVKKDGIEANLFLKAFSNGVVETLDGLDEDTNSLLLPRRFFVYVLRKRRFAMVDTMSLRAVPPQSTIFDDLRIDSNHKLIVQSLVADHFEKRRVQRQWPIFGAMNQDIVRGKGSGLFILLHGVPGVGKTATAEAVAQASNKPLFTITCGDLGLTPEAVDSKLNEVFRLAHLWDCVLLLDEADIFLARRDTFNLKRNALVSVFLRVLEYYSGILFLTTNRVGILDEAFKSRIHISLYYEPLSRYQTIEIFRVNIKKLRAIEDEKQHQLQGTGIEQPRLLIKAKSIVEYAQRYFDEQAETPHLRWNGRQIRNAFQIASSLAHYNIRKNSLGESGVVSGQAQCPVLDEIQFDKVAEAIERFGNYMDYTKAMTDADHARLEAIRADEVRNDDLAPRNRGHKIFGTPVAPASAHDRRPAASSYQKRQASAPGQAPSSHYPAVRPADNARYREKGKRDVQDQLEGAVGTTQSGGPRVRETPASSQKRAPGRVTAPARAYPMQGTPRRHAPPPRPTFDEDYGETEEEMDAPPGARTRAYDENRREEIFEGDDDVDDFDEGAAWEGQPAAFEGDGGDYDD
ncbi:hypothetical protein LZ30DRAFT_779092 [Colletotrichum cereale]|nr:hypothetical protein LZ30DRAFT_779092 [Colletotrichum cereale]